ncbi:MAG: RluA family pseudouridine synthase [Aerococcaceae bacterium]|nr:RluA family pseudouridine synthase [Aerococcaceae bacterium]
MMKYQLNNQAGRLDKVLVELTGESRATIQKWIKQEQVLVNNQIQKANFKLGGSEQITIVQAVQSEEEAFNIEPENIPLDIVYEDDDVLVVNKPAGMVVHPAKGHTSGTLVNALLYYLGQNVSDGSEVYRPGIVHRIDKDTSGLLVVAKNNKAHQALSEQLVDHTMGRTYIALVNGIVKAPCGTIEIPLQRDSNNRLKWAAHKDGKYALTTFEVLQTFKDSTLLSLELKTGRTHQIRVHLEYIGHPIVGDPVYRRGVPQMKGALAKLNEGQYLHAQSLHFIHPTTQKMLTFTSELPSRFVEIMQTLEEATTH